MNDLSSDIGLMKREFRDARTVLSRLDHQVRRLTGGRGSVDRPGGLAVRAAVCALFAHSQNRDAEAVAREHFATDRDLDRLLTLRAVSNPANSTIATWASELTSTVTTDIADRLLPESVFARLRGAGIEYQLRGGDFLRVPTWAPAASGAFVAEGAAIPVAAYTIAAITLKPKKAAVITNVTDELIGGAAVDVETSLRAILSESIGLMIDGILLDNTVASAIRPAGLLAGVTPITASAATPAATAMYTDLKALTAAITPALRPVLITGPVQAASLGLLAPNAAPTVLVAPTVAAGTLIMVDAAAFVSALGIPSFRASQNVALHEDTVPLPLSTGGVLATPMRSAFQTDTTALRSIIPVDWALRRTGAVAAVVGAIW